MCPYLLTAGTTARSPRGLFFSDESRRPRGRDAYSAERVRERSARAGICDGFFKKKCKQFGEACLCDPAENEAALGLPRDVPVCEKIGSKCRIFSKDWLPSHLWTTEVLADLRTRYLAAAARQGRPSRPTYYKSDVTNVAIHVRRGDLHPKNPVARHIMQAHVSADLFAVMMARIAADLRRDSQSLGGDESRVASTPRAGADDPYRGRGVNAAKPTDSCP